MKSIIRIPFLALVILLMTLLAGCGPSFSTSDGGLVVGQSYRLPSGESLNNDLTVMGGSATLEQGSTVNGDVAVIGGNVTIDGQVNGSVSILGGSATLNNHAHITGDVSTLGGSLYKSERAVIDGEQTENRRVPVPPVTVMRTPAVTTSFDPITGPLMAIFQGLAVAALAVLINLFAPIPMERTGRTAVSQPFASGGVGCLTLLILVIMAITIILLPVSLLGIVLIMIAALFGWASLGLMVGRQIAVWLKQPWSDPVSAGVGTLGLSLVISTLNLVLCLGGPIYTLVGLVALGAVVLTRFGTQAYPSGMAMAPRPAVPYTPPSPYSTGTAPTYDERRPDEPSDFPPVDPRDDNLA